MSERNANPEDGLKSDIEIVLPITEPTSDRGDEIQRAFRYQNAYGVILLAAGLSGQIDLSAIWCEHHEDLLVEMFDGSLVAYQIKTSSSSYWHTTDSEFVKSLRRFSELESMHGSHIYKYVFASNCRPYVATKSAKNSATIGKSPLKFAEVVKSATTSEAIPSPFDKSFSELVADGIDATHLLSVLKKLEFLQGPSRDDYEDTLVARHLPAIADCKNLVVAELAAVRDELIQKVWEASSLSIEGPTKHLGIIGPDGKPIAEKLAKRVSLEDARFVITERISHVFRYSPDALHINYGSSKSKMGVLRRKMEVGGVINHFPYIEAKAIAAEEQLMEQSLIKPEEALKKIGHIEEVVLSECHEANIKAELKPKDKRGIIMLDGMVQRLRKISKNEPDKVARLPYEVLVGLAGLLSSECKVWWGIPVTGEAKHEP